MSNPPGSFPVQAAPAVSGPPGLVVQPAAAPCVDPLGSAPQRGILDDLPPERKLRGPADEIKLPSLQALDWSPLSDVVNEWAQRRRAEKEGLVEQIQQEKAKLLKVIDGKKAEIRDREREYAMLARTVADRSPILECRDPEKLARLLKKNPQQPLFNTDSEPSTTIVFIQTLLQTKLEKSQVCRYLWQALSCLDWDNSYVYRRRHVIREAVSMYLGDDSSPDAKHVRNLLGAVIN